MTNQISIGGWCLVNQGGDPFGDPVRYFSLEEGLEACSRADIGLVSFHDRDLWNDDAEWRAIKEKMRFVSELTGAMGLRVYNFTTNLFSNECFRSGALSSPYPEVREAALVKAFRSMDVAIEWGVQNVIFWGGREGTDGSYEQNPGVGLRRYMEGIRLVLDYALAQGFKGRISIEPKVYEPRLAGLYAGTGSAASSAIKHWFRDEKYRDRVFINPEYPQHVAMLGLDPVLELGQLLEEQMLAPFIHFGGQIANRMDCDLPPGMGGNILVDFMICRLLKEYGWDGVVEFDCRPARTTTTVQGLELFLKHCVLYWRMLETKVNSYFHDPIVRKIREGLGGPSARQNELELARGNQKELVRKAREMMSSFSGFAEVAEIETDAIEAHVYRVLQILTGTQDEGSVIFDGTAWEP